MTVHVSERAGRAAEILLSVKAVGRDLEKPFGLSTGRASPIYVDVRKAASAPERRELTRLMAEAVREYPFDAVAGRETADLPFGVMVADLVDLPFVFIRGEASRLDGELGKGRKVLLVEDHASDGKALLGPLQALRAAGAVCEHAVVVFFDDLYPQAPRLLQDAGLTLHALTTWRHTIDQAEALGSFPAAEIEGIREFLKNPEAWSKARGGC